MKKQSLEYFVLGILIAFTIAVLMQSAILAAAAENAAIPVRMILQSFILAVLCSLINLVYQSEKLKFIWKSIIGYLLTTGTIITCSVYFGWLAFGGSSFDTFNTVIVLFAVCTLFYLFTWLFILQVTRAKARMLNEKLNEYKKRQ
ncbi:MAG TPA: DUF3021 family protein [Clostridia bacterium]|nr:DUF3021 family protein [Clostridia bacterium]